MTIDSVETKRTQQIKDQKEHNIQMNKHVGNK